MTAAGRARVTSPRLVGRDDELDALGEFASVLRDRHPRVALIGGRAGMGKTRLVTEAVLRWRAGGARVLIGGCVPVEGQPYAPLVTRCIRLYLPMRPCFECWLQDRRRPDPTSSTRSVLVS